MNKNKARVYLGIVLLLIMVFAIIFFMLLYSLAILDLVNDGLLGPFGFVSFMVALLFTAVWAINRWQKSKQASAADVE